MLIETIYRSWLTCFANPPHKTLTLILAGCSDTISPLSTVSGAELYGLIMALETALKVIDGFYSPEPYARVYINMDSRYVVGK